MILTCLAGRPYRSRDGHRVSVARPTTGPAAARTLGGEREETSVSDSYLGATEEELLGAPLARRLSGRQRSVATVSAPGPAAAAGSPVGAAGKHITLCAGARIMRRRLTAAFILVALIVVCVSGCHFVTVHTGPARHGSAAGG